jgi:hypothetical protein
MVAVGAIGTVFTVSVPLASDMQVGDNANLALTVWLPGATPVKVALA